MILAPIVFLQVPLRSSPNDLTARGNLTIIGAATRPHAPPENSAQDLTRSTCLHAPPGSSTRPHALSRARFLLLTSALVTSSLPRHLLTSSLTRTLTSVDFDLRLTLTVDFLQSRCSLPSFSRRFHFCSLFLHILLVNEE